MSLESQDASFDPKEILEKMRQDYWEQLGRPPAVEEGESLPALTFLVEGQVYAVRVEAVREVIKVPPWITRVPRSPRHVMGIFNLRGQIVPVLDIRQDPRGRPVETGQIVVLKNPGQDVGLYVDKVQGLPEIRMADVQKPQALTGPLTDDMILGQLEILDEETGKRKIAVLIDPAAFLRSDAFSFSELR